MYTIANDGILMVYNYTKTMLKLFHHLVVSGVKDMSTNYKNFIIIMIIKIWPILSYLVLTTKELKIFSPFYLQTEF